MEVGLSVLGEVKVDNDVDCRNVDTASEEIGGDKVAALALAEVVEDAVAMGLNHLGVDVEAGEAELRNALGKELDTVDRVAEDDALVNVELWVC